MITKSKAGNTWEVGEMVKVGFLTLKVLAKVPTPGDYMPDAQRPDQVREPRRGHVVSFRKQLPQKPAPTVRGT